MESKFVKFIDNPIIVDAAITIWSNYFLAHVKLLLKPAFQPNASDKVYPDASAKTGIANTVVPITPSSNF